MSAPILKGLEALEGRGTGGAHPMLVIVSFITTLEGEPGPVGIDAGTHFPEPVNRLPEESWDAFTRCLEGMLSHFPGGAVVLAFARNPC